MIKIWYLICFLFAIHCLSYLFEERYEVFYANSKKDEKFEYLICLDLRKFYKNRSEISLSEMNIGIFQFFKSLENSKEKIKKELILNQIKNRNFYVYKGLYCLNTKNLLDLEIIYQVFHLKSVHVKCFIFKKENYVFLNLKSNVILNLKIDQLVVYNKEYPYSNCLKDYSQFNCLNNCFKSKYKLADYFYEGNEATDLIIILHYKVNKSINDNEIKCFKKCKFQNCKLTKFIELFNNAENKTVIFEAYPLITDFDFFIQLFGFLALFFGNSIYQIISKFTKNIKNEKNLITSKGILIAINLIYFLFMSIKLILIFKSKLDNPFVKGTTVRLLEPDPVISLVFCEPLSKITTKGERNRNKGKTWELQTLKELENDSMGRFEKLIKEIYMETNKKKRFVEWAYLKSKILFLDRQGCYQVNFYLNEFKYHNLLAHSKLVIKSRVSFQTHSLNLYILPRNEEFDSKTFQYTERHSFFKRVNKYKKK